MATPSRNISCLHAASRRFYSLSQQMGLGKIHFGSMSPNSFHLNDQQKEAVRYTGGPLLVVAGAGSGKTRVIIEKMIYLVRERGLPSARIAAITFTNKAAREMKKRLAGRLGAEKAAEITVSTFHSLGWKILRAHAEQLGYRPGISILDESDSQTVVRDLLPEGTAPEMVRLARSQVSRWKNRALLADELGEAGGSPGEAAIHGLYQRYEAHLKDLNAVDFDDLILQPLRALRDEEIRLSWQQEIRYLLVDEYQDTNETQYQMLTLLAGPPWVTTISPFTVGVAHSPRTCSNWRLIIRRCTW